MYREVAWLQKNAFKTHENHQILKACVFNPMYQLNCIWNHCCNNLKAWRSTSLEWSNLICRALLFQRFFWEETFCLHPILALARLWHTFYHWSVFLRKHVTTEINQSLSHPSKFKTPNIRTDCVTTVKTSHFHYTVECRTVPVSLILFLWKAWPTHILIYTKCIINFAGQTSERWGTKGRNCDKAQSAKSLDPGPNKGIDRPNFGCGKVPEPPCKIQICMYKWR